MGAYWLYFSSQKWVDRTWVNGLLDTAARDNYIPIYRELLANIAAPNAGALSLLTAVAEAAIGTMILLGLFTRIAGAVGVVLNLNLVLTFALCSCPWAVSDFPLVFWFYFGPLLLNVQLVFDQSSMKYGMERFITTAQARSDGGSSTYGK